MFILRDTFREEFDLQLNQLRRITSHGPSIGRFIEHLLIRLLSKYLPKSVSFSSGFIKGVSIGIGASPQIDIICYDSFNFPVIFDTEEFKVIPAMAVKGLIEVKASLTKSQLLKVLQTSCAIQLSEVPLTSKISPKNAFDTIRKFYSEKPKIIKFFSAIYSLDWPEIIICSSNYIENKIELEIIRLHIPERNDIAIFVSKLMHDIYGSRVSESINNNLAPSIFIPLETCKYTLYTNLQENELKRNYFNSDG